jgi:hypothetical protein
VVPQRGAASSPHTIIVQPPGAENVKPGTYWLDPPPDGQADIVVELPLTEPAGVEFRVTAFAPQPVHNSVTLALAPGVAYTREPGVVVPIPGLYIPQFSAHSVNGAVQVQAKVQMMCGCPITLPPAPPNVEPYWPSYEFEVTAIFLRLHPKEDLPAPRYVPLSCSGTDVFTANVTLPSGTYAALVSAIQPSTGNRGSASAHVVVQQ